MKNISNAIIAVMNDVNGIEKNSTVGTGGYSYKGVSDKDVKQTFKKAMAKQGLCILPIKVTPNHEVKRWTEKGKGKQQVFCSVTTKYLLLHTSGESIELEGFGHGVDSQDKAAGKATTYALKYTLLYTFLTPTGAIDDADKTHSQEIDVPTIEEEKPSIKDNDLQKVIDYAIQEGWSIKDLEEKRTITPTQKATIIKGLKEAKK